MWIDDEFDKIVRQMFEHFFGTTMPIGTEGRAVFEIGVSSTPAQTSRSREVEQTRPNVERIDLEDRTIILIEGIDEEHRPTVRVDRGRVIVEMEDNRITFDIDFRVDPRKSYATLRNGIVEIDVVRSTDDNVSTDEVVIEYR